MSVICKQNVDQTHVVMETYSEERQILQILILWEIVFTNKIICSKGRNKKVSYQISFPVKKNVSDNFFSEKNIVLQT